MVTTFTVAAVSDRRPEFGHLRAQPAVECGSGAAAFLRRRPVAFADKGGSCATAGQGAQKAPLGPLGGEGGPGDSAINISGIELKKMIYLFFLFFFVDFVAGSGKPPRPRRGYVIQKERIAVVGKPWCLLTAIQLEK